MPTQEQLIEYLREGTKQGASHQQLVEQLLEHGWALADINAAFNAMYRPVAPVAPVRPAMVAQPTPTPVVKPAVAAAPAPQPAVSTPPPVVVAPVTAPAPVVAPVVTAAPAPASSPAPQSAPTRPISVSSTLLTPTTPATSTVQPPATISTPPYIPPTGGMPKLPVKALAMVGVAVLVILLVAGGVYAYFNKMGPFARIPYTEENIFSGILEKAAQMQSSTYEITGEIVVEDREEGAEPFALQVSNEEENRQNYQNDSVRAQSVSRLLSYLRSVYDSPLPKTITALEAAARARSGAYIGPFSINDPLTGTPYDYRLTENGGNFALTVTFETTNAASTLKRSFGYTEEATTINGTTVTFTKDSSPYMYLPTEPPKPFIVSLGEMLRYLPSEMQAQFGITAASQWQEEDADWTFNVNAEGDFGDLTYKVNADARKIEDIYYFRINNMPSVFGSLFGSMKGQWVKVDPAAASSTASQFGQFSQLSEQFSSTEESYKEARAEWVAFIKKVMQFADEEKLAKFVEEPRSEKLDGRLLYRYDLETRKEAILPFYEKVVAEAANNPDAPYSKLLNDQGLVEYLKSEEFSQVFDYLNEYTTQTLWVDPHGFPARLEYAMTIVPPDSASELAGKQVRITWVLNLSDINEKVEIEIPEDARSIEDITADTTTSLGQARAKGTDARIQSLIRSIAVYAEIYYDNNGNSYGPSTASCTGGIFSSKDPNVSGSMSDLISSSAEADPLCYASPSAWAVQHPLTASDARFCMDSTGKVSQSATALSKTACP